MDGDEKKSLSNSKRIYATFNGVSVGLNGNASGGFNDSIKGSKNDITNGDFDDSIKIGKNDSISSGAKDVNDGLKGRRKESVKDPEKLRHKGISTNAAMFHFMKGKQ